MLTYILVALAIAAVAFIIVVAMQPSTFRVSRSATIDAPASAIFPHINNLHSMQVWSPWEKMDPNMERTYEGPPAGPGATYRWSGNNKIGEGSMILTNSRPNELVEFQLNFIKPFQCTNEVEYTLVPQAGNTVVTWSMTGHNKFINKAVCLFMNMDKMCGGQFEEGLASLKAIAEGTAPQAPREDATVLPLSEPAV